MIKSREDEVKLYSRSDKDTFNSVCRLWQNISTKIKTKPYIKVQLAVNTDSIMEDDIYGSTRSPSSI